MRLALRTIFVFLATAAMCATPGALFGQAVNGSILGAITDASGGSVPNAQVTITEGSTNISRTTRSNESGNYVFPDVTP